MINTLENSTNQYRVMVHADSDILAQAKDLETDFTGAADYFWSARNQIHWDAHTGVKWVTALRFKVEKLPGDTRLGFDTQIRPGVKCSISPAITLIHELGHAYDKEIAPVRFEIEVQTHIGGRWDTLEERRVMREIEWPVVRELGENAGSTDAPRPSHNGIGTYGYQMFEFSTKLLE